MTEELIIDSYEPDYTEKCENCENRPVVTAILDGKVVHNFHLCGPCTFGEASCLDPEEWNIDEES